MLEAFGRKQKQREYLHVETTGLKCLLNQEEYQLNIACGEKVLVIQFLPCQKKDLLAFFLKGKWLKQFCYGILRRLGSVALQDPNFEIDIMPHFKNDLQRCSSLLPTVKPMLLDAAGDPSDQGLA